jgi:arylsulfatase A-like enzyme
MRSCIPNFEFAPSQTFTVGDAIRMAGDDDEYQDGAFFAGKWHLGSFFNDSEAYGGKTSSPITHGFHHYNATVEVAPTATVNCQCKEEWRKDCNFGHYNTSNHCWPDPKDCCFNYWWDDPLSPHGVANLTWQTPEDDSVYLADSLERFLAKREDSNQPWYAQISFHSCHIPFIGTDQAKAACAEGETCQPPDKDDPPYTDTELDYYGCLTQLDQAVGRVLQAVENSGYYDNTMIWFTSDNGPEQNCKPAGICEKAATHPHRPKEGPGSAGPLRGRKRDIYEGGHRVAGLVSFPALVKDNRESWETVVTMDFLPTVMEVLGVSRPPEQESWAMDGRSILPLLMKPETFQWQQTEEGPRSIGIGYYNANLTIVHGWGYRYGRWKYVEGSESCTVDSCRTPQLFDLESDLGERHDLSKVYPDVLADLKEKFLAWHRSVMRSRRLESKCQKVKDLTLPKSFDAATIS